MFFILFSCKIIQAFLHYYRIINDLVAQGKAVIVISSELPEVLGISDRIYIMNEGSIIGELDAKEATQEIIMRKIVTAKNKEAQ
jgi:putative multiple sugar transport system ATP-binding protein